MKKTLVALAAVSAVSAFAQSTVTIDGFMDRGYLALSNSNSTKNFKSVASNSGTTTLGFKYYEELGGGLKIGGQLNTDWADIGGASQGSGIALAQTSGFANSQSFAQISSATMGTLNLGTPNQDTLVNNTAIASPEFSTGVGSAYSTVFSTANGFGTGTTGYGGTVYEQAAITAAANVGARAIRINNTIQYKTPVFNGFQFGYAVTPQNNNLTAASGYGNTVGVTEYSLRYTNGPVDAMYSSIKYDVGSNGISQIILTAPTSSATATIATAKSSTVGDNTQNMLGVKYQVLPSLKLNVGIGSFTSSTGTYQGSSRGYGGTYTMGAVDILAQIVQVNDTSTTDTDRKLTGLGVNYNLSKTSKAYFRYDSINYGTNVTAISGSTQKRTGFGISKSF
jgi:predicted porin